MTTSNIKFLMGITATVLITVFLGFVFSPNELSFPEVFTTPINAIVEWGLSLSVFQILGTVAVILIFGGLSVVASREYRELSQ